jgi:hypothetical protein
MKYEEIKVNDYHSLMNMSFEKYHTSKSQGVFECDGLPIHGKKVYIESISFKNKRGEFFNSKKNKQVFFIESGNIFQSFKELIEFYCKDVIV